MINPFKRDPKHLDEADKADITNLYNAGFSENKISKQFGLTRNIIRKVLIERNLKIRTQSEAEILKWSQMKPEQRKHQIEAYHNSIRGCKRSHESLVKRAKSVQGKCKLSGKETYTYNFLLAIGMKVTPLFAVDIFNIDFADVDSKVAYELNTGHWHQSDRKVEQDLKKKLYLEANGWKVVVIPDFTPKSCRCILTHVG